jgi:hypothetical protein
MGSSSPLSLSFLVPLADDGFDLLEKAKVVALLFVLHAAQVFLGQRVDDLLVAQVFELGAQGLGITGDSRAEGGFDRLSVGVDKVVGVAVKSALSSLLSVSRR